MNLSGSEGDFYRDFVFSQQLTFDITRFLFLFSRNPTRFMILLLVTRKQESLLTLSSSISLTINSNFQEFINLPRFFVEIPSKGKSRSIWLALNELYWRSNR